jgi:putative PEP-CTERM system TPR-repeat lipoprotein
VDTFKRLAKRQPESVGAHYLLGRAHLQAEQPDRARQDLEKAVALDPETPRPRLVLARLLMQQNRLDQAEEEIAQLRDAFPGKPTILDLAGELAYRQGEPAEAARIYGKANEVAPGTRFVTRKAGAQWAAGDRTGSVETLRTWLEAHPEDATAQLALAQRYQNMGRVEQAVAGYRELLSLAPENPVVHNNLAWLLRTRQPEEALHHVKRARELAPDSPEIQDTHAMILLDQGKEGQAIRILQRVVERRPDNPTLRFHLAQALLEDDKRQAAREQLETVLSVKRRFPEREEARALQQQLRP